MSKMKTLLSDLTQVLYELDLANTSCKENELFDEYEAIAEVALTAYLCGTLSSLSQCVEWRMMEAFERDFNFPEFANDKINELVK